MDEFNTLNKLNKPVTFRLVKVRNGCFRIARNGGKVLEVSSKAYAIDYFDKLREKLGIYE